MHKHNILALQSRGIKQDSPVLYDIASFNLREIVRPLLHLYLLKPLMLVSTKYDTFIIYFSRNNTWQAWNSGKMSSYCSSLSATCEAANPPFALHSNHIFLLQVVERRRTPAEIREEYERLQKEREERRLQQRTNPKVCSGEDNKLHIESTVT